MLARPAELTLAALAQWTGWPTLRRAAFVVLGVLAVTTGAKALFPDRLSLPSPPPVSKPSHGAPLTYDAALARADQQLAGVRPLAAAHPDEWLQQERLAHAWIARARLTGSFDDFAAAQTALDQGFAHAKPGTGPHLAQATLDVSLHRLAH